MNERQRGVAHVNVFWVVITLILFLGAAGFAYLQTTELGKERARRDAAERERESSRSQQLERVEQLQDLTKLIGFIGDYKTVAGTAVEGRFTSPDLLKAQLEELRKSFSVAGTSLAELVDPLRKTLKAQEDLAKQSIAERDEARTQRQAQIDALAKLQSEKDALITKLNGDISEASASLSRQMGEMNASLATNRQSLERAQEEVRTTKEASTKTESELKRDLSLRDAVIAAQADRTKMINPPQAPDGEIISSLDSVGLAWINLGTRDQLRPGTIFDILEKTKTGLAPKGRGEVTRVEMDRAELRIIQLNDKYRPVVKGDVIANEVYSPNATRNIVLMGRFLAGHTKEEVKRLLEQLGNKVHDKVSPHVDLVILGRGEFGEGGEVQPLEATEEYKKAVTLGIEMVGVNRIKDLLKR